MSGLMWAAAGCAALAGAWAFPAPLAVEVGRRAKHPPRALRWVALGGLVTVALLLVVVVFGRPVAVLGVAVAMVSATGLGSWWRARRAGARLRARGEVARACRVLASELRLGQVPSRALTRAADDCAVLGRASACAAIGADVSACWQEQAAEPGFEGLRELARSWRLAETTGAPLAESLGAVAEALRASHKVDQTVAGELAAPRMTGRLLAALPAFGLMLGYLLGGDPVGFLLEQPWGNLCLLVGTALACGGLIWTDHLADQVGRAS